MDIKEGSDVKYTGKDEYGLTQGSIYEVISIDPIGGNALVADELDDTYLVPLKECKPITQPEEPVDWRLTNRAPWGLLTEQEKKEMLDWPHGWEWFDTHQDVRGWLDTDLDDYDNVVYRAKPAPEVTSRWLAITEQMGMFDRQAAMPLGDQESIGMIRIDTDENGNETLHVEDV